jgi:hypothetical protein
MNEKEMNKLLKKYEFIFKYIKGNKNSLMCTLDHSITKSNFICLDYKKMKKHIKTHF